MIKTITTDSHSRVYTIEDWLSNQAEKEFLNKYRGSRSVIFKGNISRFDKLFSWDDLNVVLSDLDIQFPRLRLVRDGQTADVKTYSKYVRSNIKNDVYWKCNPEIVQDMIRNGYTLILNKVDRLVPSVRHMSTSMERFFDDDVNANLYFGCSQSTGFAPHWDGHDVYVFQLYGKKRWIVQNGGRKAPLDKDAPNDNSMPDEVLWDGDLCQGDILYLPRGTWHSATAYEEPSLHITFGVSHATGIDFVEWITNKLREDEYFRSDILSLKKSKMWSLSEIEQRFISRLRSTNLDAFDEHRSVKSTHRLGFSFPTSTYDFANFKPLMTSEFKRLVSELKIRQKSDSSFELLAANKAYELSTKYQKIAQFICVNELFNLEAYLAIGTESEISYNEASQLLHLLCKKGIFRNFEK